MTAPVIAVEADRLYKEYRIGWEGDHYLSLRDALASGARATASRISGSFKRIRTPPRTTRAPGGASRFNALDGVSFQVPEGEACGLIGRNGSGKSTLLRILSRITVPTSGQARIRGRLSSLLEVGTGFHGELTGRENILLNAAILGMKHHEIKSRFDEIVAFAEVEAFLDTPVKRYSSGMFIRLAFAVAAHLEPDILLVDEVLAVGDAAFQRKCLSKLGEVGQQGRTILFVSHNMSAIEQLCTSAIVLDNGKVIEHSSDVKHCIQTYARHAGAELELHRWEGNGERIGVGFEPKAMYLGTRDGAPLPSPQGQDDEAWVHIEGDIDESAVAVRLGYALMTADGVVVYSSHHTDADDSSLEKLPNGAIHLRSRIPPRLLNAGTFRIEMTGSVHGRPLFPSRDSSPAISLVLGTDLHQTQFWMLKRAGVIAPDVVWEKAT